ncbi:MAG: DUF371 domain-containing protein [Candidatus Bathyarchaeia archaeon]
MRVIELIEARGHKKIKATHGTTFEITKENFLTERGDCIIAIKASKSVFDLSNEFKNLARNKNTVIKVLMESNGFKELAIGYGNEALSFTNKTSIVVRKSNYICPRTLMINSNKAAKDFSRDFIKLLQNPNQKINITIIAEIEKVNQF